MNRFFRVLTAAALLTALVGMGSMGAAAQENETAIENESDREQLLEERIADDLNGTTVDTLEKREIIRFNNDTRIVGWEFGDESVTVAIHTDRRTGVTVSDALAGIGKDGAVQVPKTSKFLEREEVTTVTMDVTEFKGGQSVAVEVDGLTVRLSTEMDEESSDNPLRYFGGEEGLFTGMGMSVTTAGGAALFVIWREETGVIKA